MKESSIDPCKCPIPDDNTGVILGCSEEKNQWSNNCAVVSKQARLLLNFQKQLQMVGWRLYPLAYFFPDRLVL